MMLYNTMVGYRNVRAAWQGKIKEPHDVMMLIARLRKALLKKILEGNLSPEEIEMLEAVRQNDN